MKYTNKYNLPEPFYNAVVNAYEQRADYISKFKPYMTTTNFTLDPTEIQLRKRHGHIFERDVSDNTWSLFGQAVHAILEKSGADLETEKTYQAEINGKDICGTVDLYDKKTKTLTDYKVTKTYSYILGDMHNYEIQMNINAYLMFLNGINVDNLEIVFMFKDWTRSKALTDKQYPQADVMRYKVKKWDSKATHFFMMAAMERVKELDNILDDDLPECSPEARWSRGDKYAVMKGENKRAVRLLDSQDDAEKYIKDHNLDAKHHIVYRKAEDTKCMYYCDCKSVCPYFKKYYKGE